LIEIMEINALEHEDLLIEKELYSCLGIDEEKNPIQALSSLLKQMDNPEDQTIIRFIQGERYYLLGDFESAIFKWKMAEDTRLSEWASKNMGDAYMKDGQFEMAEKYYQRVGKDASLTLWVEKSLDLFNLYISNDEEEKAVNILKEAVKRAPDYKNLSVQALDFYEDREMWHQAAFLIRDELNRTGSCFWILKFKEYGEKERLQVFHPEEFISTLPIILKNEQSIFNEIIVNLWSGYQPSPFYLEWLKAFHNIFPSLEMEGNNWYPIDDLCKESFRDLLFFDFDMEEVVELIPLYLCNWWKMTPREKERIKGFILSWVELHTYSFDSDFLEEVRSWEGKGTEERTTLTFIPLVLSRFVDWLKDEGFGIPSALSWELEHLGDFNTLHLVITGTFSNGKSSIINSLLGEEVLETEVLPTTSTMVVLSSGSEQSMTLIKGSEIQPLSSIHEFKAVTTIDHKNGKGSHTKGYIHYQLPNPFLEENRLRLVDSPGFNDEKDEENEVLDHLYLGDGVLFVLNARTPFTKEEKNKLTEIMEKQDLPLHFILNKVDIAEDEDEEEDIIVDTRKKVKKYFKEAQVQPFSSYKNSDGYKKELQSFIESNFRGTSILKQRTTKLTAKLIEAVEYVKTEDMMRKEKEYNRSIKNRLSAVSAILKEKQAAIDYFSQWENELLKELRVIKNALINSVWEKVPQRMGTVSRILRPESDLQTIHVQLNQYMNQELSLCWESELKPTLLQKLQTWQSAIETIEMKINFEHKRFVEKAGQLSEREVDLRANKQFTSAWLYSTVRDIARLSLPPVAILPNVSPMRLLTGVQKLIGGSSQSFFYNRYKTYLENNTYLEAVQGVLNEVLPFFDKIEETITEGIKQTGEVLSKQADEEINTLRNINKIEAGQLNAYLSNREKYNQKLNLFLFAARSGQLWSESDSPKYVK
jgi:GTP-binding protein EngB required for normal cell division/tetratricopeptide (TPR) repeat protein